MAFCNDFSLILEASWLRTRLQHGHQRRARTAPRAVQEALAIEGRCHLEATTAPRSTWLRFWMDLGIDFQWMSNGFWKICLLFFGWILIGFETNFRTLECIWDWFWWIVEGYPHLRGNPLAVRTVAGTRLCRALYIYIYVLFCFVLLTWLSKPHHKQ